MTGAAAQDALQAGLQALLANVLPTSALPAFLSAAGGGATVRKLRRLSGGASQETWAFDWGTDALAQPLILRRAPPGAAQRDRGNPGLAGEAALMRQAGPAGVPVPQVLLVLQPQHGLGDGFIMQRLPGEALGRRIAAAHRPLLAQQCGAALARIHAMPLASLPPLRSTQPVAEVAYLRNWHARHGTARPVFQLALRWLAMQAPADVAPVLVHGDFRNGNLLVDLDCNGGALTGVLDWELAHGGDAMADLAWLGVPSWCFGQPGRPVGGFGQWAELFDGYRSAGGQVDEARLHWWRVLGTLRWGVMCESMGHAWATGAEPVMEKAAIARRASETEIDLLTLLLPMRQHPTAPAQPGMVA